MKSGVTEKGWISWLAGLLMIGLVAGIWSALGFDRPNAEALILRPYPDATEQVWQAVAFTQGKLGLMPIGDELHPVRYSPVHSLFLAACIFVGGNWTAVFAWPPVALVLGFGYLHSAMARMKVGLIARAAVILILGTSVLLIRISQEVLQESTIFLLFCTDLLLIQSSVRQEGPKKIRLLAGFASGAVSGALICIRPTYALWVVAKYLFMFRERLRLPLPFLLGLAAVLALDMLYVHAISSRWALQAYAHWSETKGFFSLSHLAHPHSWPDDPHQSAWQRLWAGVLGLNTDVSVLGFPVGLFLLLGGAVGLLPLWKERSLLPHLWLFVWMQAAAHALYFFYDSRFLVTLYPAVVVTGIAGWERFLHGRKLPLGHANPVLAGRCAGGFAGCLLLIPHVQQETAAKSEKVFARLSDETGYKSIVSEDATLRGLGLITKKHQGPLFIDAVDTVAARLQLGLEDWPYPIYQAAWRLNWGTELWYEAHYCGLYYATRPYGPHSLQRPFDVYLVRDEKLNKPLAEELLGKGDVLLLYNGWREGQFAEALKLLRERPHTHHQTPSSAWRLLCVSGENASPAE